MIDGLKLDKRLRSIVDLVDGDALADVGCDHGKVSIACLAEGRVKSVIACDISQKSLQKAVDLAKLFGVDGIQFRVGDGLSVIADGEVDCVVIAGMGGSEIMNILANMPKGVERLVLSPQKNIVELREFLSQSGYYIAKDIIVEESGKFYVVIKAETSKDRDCSLDRAQILLGGVEQTDDFEKYMAHIQQKYDTLSKQSPSCRQCRLYEEMLVLAKERERCSK